MVWLAIVEGIIGWMLLSLVYNATGRKIFSRKRVEKTKVVLVLKNKSISKAGSTDKPKKEDTIKYFD